MSISDPAELHSEILPKINGAQQEACDGQVPTPDLTALVAVVLKEHEAAIQGLSFALEHAMACGDALLKVQESLLHGKWLPFLKRLENQPGGPAERTALRYVQLAKNRALIMARLAALNSPRVANLVSVRQAVALIPKPPRPTQASATTPRSRSSSTVTTPPKLDRHVISQWLSKAPVEDRQKVLDALGSRAVNESIPPSWGMQLAPAEELTRLQKQIAELEAAIPPRQRKRSLSPPKPTNGDGLDIPDCLRRIPILPANDAAIVPDEVPHHGGNGSAPLSIDAPPVSVEKTAA